MTDDLTELATAIIRASRHHHESDFGRWIECPFCEAMSDGPGDWAEYASMPRIAHRDDCVVRKAVALMDGQEGPWSGI